jgi:hypothetical protein
MTPYELNVCAEVYAETSESKHMENLTLVWLGEYYHRVKNLPKLEDEINRIFKKNAKQGMSDKEMMRVVEQLNIQLGGTVEQGGE